MKVVESGFKGAPLIFVWLMLNELFAESINIQRVILLSFGLAACYVLQAVFHYWTDTINFPAVLRILGDLRIRLGEHIRKLSMGFFLKNRLGS